MDSHDENERLNQQLDSCVKQFAQLAPRAMEKVNRIFEEPSSDNVLSPCNLQTETRSLSSDKSTPIITRHNYPSRMYRRGSISTSSHSSFLHKLMEASINESNYDESYKFKPATPLPSIASISGLSPINNSIFFNTPIFHSSPKIGQEETLESLASQLRGMITVLDMGMDLRKNKLELLERIKSAKYKKKQDDLNKKEVELKKENSENQKKFFEFKMRKQQDIERMKNQERITEDIKEETRGLKSKVVDQGVQLSEYRLKLRKLEKEVEETSKLLEEEKRKKERNAKVASDLAAKVKAQEEAQKRRLSEISTQKLFPKPNNRPYSRISVGGSSSGSSGTPSPSLPFVFPQPLNEAVETVQSTKVDKTHTKTPSTSSTKIVRWQEPLASEFSSEASDDVFEEDGDTGELLKLIPSDMKECVDESETSMDCFRKFFCNREMYIKWFKVKRCGCERLLYETDDFHYRSNHGIIVDICFIAENRQIIIAFEGLKIVAYPNKQLEINRNKEDKTIFTPEGMRWDQIKYSNGCFEETFVPGERKRIFPNKQVENLDPNDEKQAERPDGSYSSRINGADFVYHPLFELKRKDSVGYDGVFELQVYHLNTGKNKRIQVNVCPKESVIFIKHCTMVDGKFNKILCTTMNQCDHLKK